jgi:hypothetical protein
MPRFINLLRSTPTFFSFLVFNYIDQTPERAHLLSFSCVPAIFQNGWCLEESALWSSFLTSYSAHLTSLPLNSAHFLPFRAFFLQKLGTDYLPRVLFDELEVLLFQTEANEERLQFDFDEDSFGLLPIVYINTLTKTARKIVALLNLHLSRIPVSVRSLLKSISERSMKICGFPLNGIDLSMFFFLECLFLPVIRKPSLVGVDTDPSYVLDDLAHLFFFSHFISLMPSPPLVMPMLRIVGRDSICFFGLIKDLICSVAGSTEYSSEFREANFAKIIPEYSKLAQFHPLDLFELHTAAVLAARTATEMLPADALAQFDYLLEVAPGVNPIYQYDVFAVELLCPERNEQLIPIVNPELDDCFANVLRNARPELFEFAPLEKVLEFCGKTVDSSIANASVICRSRTMFLKVFLIMKWRNGIRQRKIRHHLQLKLGFRLMV